MNNTGKIVVLDAGYDSYAYEIQLLQKHGYHLNIFDGAYDDWQGKIDFAKDAVGVFVRWTVVNDAFFKALPKLQAVVRYGVGYDNIDIEAANNNGIKIANVQGYANHAVSDHALALMFACARSVKPWHPDDSFGVPPRKEIFEFHDKTLGIIGLGRIGGTLSGKVQSLFQHVLAYDPYIPDQRFKILGAVKVDLQTVLKESNIISLHCNLTDETRHLIQKQQFDQMQQQPILINTSRGPVVKRNALRYALDKNIIHSAGLDVYETEPPNAEDLSILSYVNVVGTGHVAWYSDASSAELQKRAANNMLAMLQGKVPADCLN